MRLTTVVSHDNALPLLCAKGGFLDEEFSQMLLHIEPRGDRLQGGVGVHLVASKYNSSPQTNSASMYSSTTRSKNSRTTDRPQRSRMRVRLEWSGKASKRS
jgi:hypothetical protein